MNKLIPKTIHVSWPTKDIVYSKSKLIELGLNNLISKNSNWKINIYDNDDIDSYLKQNIAFEFYSLLENEHIVAKLDVWRLIKIYNEGGLYFDLDRFCDIVLDNEIDENAKWVLAINDDFDFSQDFILSAPNNPVLFETIEAIYQRRKIGYTNIYLLGAQTYMQIITKCIFGESIDTNPGKEIFKDIFNALDKINFIQVFKEKLPYFSFLNRNSSLSGDDWSIYKMQLYKEFNLKHWTNNW